MSLLLRTILEAFPHTGFIGNDTQNIYGIKNLDDLSDIRNGDLYWVNEKNGYLLSQIQKGTVIVADTTDRGILNKNVNYILVPAPRLYFLKVIKKFFVKDVEYNISGTAIIHSSASIPKHVYLGDNVIIEENVSSGSYTRISANTIIKKDSQIGKNVTIGSNCIVGSDGFGYERNEEGEYEQLPHLGNVIIGNNVNVGNNTCIDRGVIGSTNISNNVKIGNLVHIAHGVKVGESTLIINNVTIAGSAVIGKDCWIAPSSTIIGKINIGDGAMVGLGSVVINNVEENYVVVGNPAKFIRLRK